MTGFFSLWQVNIIIYFISDGKSEGICEFVVSIPVFSMTFQLPNYSYHRFIANTTPVKLKNMDNDSIYRLHAKILQIAAPNINY